MVRARACIIVAAGLSAVAVAGCGAGDTPSTTTQRTLPGGRLGGTPVIAFTAPRDVTVAVGEATAVRLTVTNQSQRTLTLRLVGSGSGIDVRLSPVEATLRPRDAQAVTLTLLAHRPATGTPVDIIASRPNDPLQAWRTTIRVDARAS